MTTKTLNTRIRVRYDSYANWMASTQILLPGELAVAYIPSDTPDVNYPETANAALNLNYGANVKAVLVKVGDGASRFSALPFVTAQAGDVYNWAKKQNGEAADITIADVGNHTTTTNVEAALAEIYTAIEGIQGTGAGVSLASLKTAIDLLNDADNVEGSVAYAVKTAVDAEATRINGVVGTPDANKTIQAEIDDVEGRLDTLEGNASTAGSVAKAIADFKTDVTGTPDAGTTLQDEIDAVEADIATLNSNATVTGSVDKKIADAIDGLDLTNTYAAKSYEARVAANETKLATLIGSETGDDGKSARTMAAEEVAKVVANAPASYDTLKEIADWIQSDTTGAAKMANDITALKTKTELGTYEDNGEQVEYATVRAYVEAKVAATGGDVTTLAGRVTTAENNIDALDGRLDTAESDIDTLETRVGTAEDDIDALETRASTAEGKITALETKVDTTGTVTAAIAAAKTEAIEAVDFTVAANGTGETNKVLTGFEVADGALVSNSITTTTLADVAISGKAVDLNTAADEYLVLFGGTASADFTDPYTA